MATHSNDPSHSGRGSLVPTGVEGLDRIFAGGLVANRIYLVEGTPGCGKTTLGLQFLLEGARRSEVVLYVTLSETKEELEEVAESHGWDLGRIHIIDSHISEESLRSDEQSTMFDPAESELSEMTERFLAEVERLKPSRIVFDSLSEFRLMARTPLRYRQQILGLKRYFNHRKCTVLLLDDRRIETTSLHLQTVTHGVIQLEQFPLEYGPERRRLRVVKMRGRNVALGWHDFAIRTGGLTVYPRLVAIQTSGSDAVLTDQLSSGIAELDVLLGGGPATGTSTLILGPAGAGKSVIAYQYAIAAADRGEHACIFSLDESLPAALRRARGLGMDLEKHLRTGHIQVQQVDRGQLSPGEFAGRVAQAVEPVEGPGAKVLVLDSLNGYLNAMPEERSLMIQLHELLSYAGQHGVVTLIVMAQHGLIGPGTDTPVDTTFLVDNVILLRFFEAAGQIKRAISVSKVRSGSHENTIREFQIGHEGLQIGQPLRQFQGVLSGEPQFLGGTEPLMK